MKKQSGFFFSYIGANLFVTGKLAALHVHRCPHFCILGGRGRHGFFLFLFILFAPTKGGVILLFNLPRCPSSRGLVSFFLIAKLLYTPQAG